MNSMEIDSSGNIYITGFTNSAYPTTVGAYNSSTQRDIVISKFNNSLTSLVASTYFGGATANEYVGGIVLDDSGNIYISGTTGSSGFPTTVGAYDTSFNGLNNDFFVSKFSNDLTSLLASTFVGGSGTEATTAVADLVIDSNGSVITGGDTASANFPVTVGAFDASFVSGNAAIFKLSSDLSTLEASTFLGTGSPSYVVGVSLDSSDNIFIAGYTFATIPATVGAYDTTANGNYDAYIVKFNNNLTSLAAATYLGGSLQEFYNNSQNLGFFVGVDDNVWITLPTNSSGFPTTVGAYDTSFNGNYDVIVAKLSGNLTTLQYSTFLGGAGIDVSRDIRVDSMGDVVVSGNTPSADFPVTVGAYDTTLSGTDCFLTKFNSTLSTVRASTFIGGSGTDSGGLFKFDAYNNPIIALYTASSDFPVTVGAYDTSYNGGTFDFAIFNMNADLLLVSNNNPTNISLSASSINEAQASGTTIGALTTTDADGGDTHTYSFGCATPGADDSHFQISGSNLQSAEIFDYESPADANADNSYQICIRTNDGNYGGIYDKNFTITVADLNEAPTNITLSNSTIQENQALGTNIGSLTTSDPNLGDTHTYSFGCTTPGADDSHFQISGANLQSAQVFDYETKSSYSICIRTNDGTDTYDKNFIITITDVTETTTTDDTTPPTTPTEEPDLDSTSDTGTEDDDDITSDESPTITGECRDENTVTIYVDGDEEKDNIDCEDGEFKTTLNLEEGEFEITYTETDPSGNESEESPKLEITIDEFADISIDDETNTPTNLSVEAIFPSGVRITWVDESDTENFYIIERRIGSGPFTQIATLPKNTQSYTDYGLIPGLTYSYRVRGIKGKNFTPYSNEKSITIMEGETIEEKEEIKEETKEEGEVKEEITPTKEESRLETDKEEEKKEKQAIIQSITSFIKENPIISKTISLAGIISGVALTLAIGSIPFLPLTPSPFRADILSLISAPFRRKHKKQPWGTVFDSYTKQPIKNVTVTLNDERGLPIETTVTDDKGRFGFLISKEGNYQIKATKGEYKIKTDQQSDPVYGGTYDGKFFNVQKDMLFKTNIALDPQGFNWDQFTQKVLKRYSSMLSVIEKYVLSAVFIIGLAFSIIATAISPSILNYLVLFFYIIVIAWQTAARIRKPYGNIKTKENKRPVPFALVGVYDEQGKRKTFAVSDVIGRYYLLTDDGQYGLKVQGRTEEKGYFTTEGQTKIKEGILRDDLRV